MAAGRTAFLNCGVVRNARGALDSSGISDEKSSSKYSCFIYSTVQQNFTVGEPRASIRVGPKAVQSLDHA